MMGCQEAPAQLFYDFSLDDHVTADHMLRGIDRHLELDSVRGPGFIVQVRRTVISKRCLNPTVGVSLTFKGLGS